MNTLLADPPSPPAPAAPPPEPPPAAERPCANCGAALDPAQDWCLECGAGAPDGVGGRPGWRSAAAIIAAVGVLVLGAVAASYAALSSSPKRMVRSVTVAQTPPPATPAPVTPSATPPKIPRRVATPPPAKVTPPPAAIKPTPAPTVSTPAPAPAAAAPAPVTHKTTPTKPSKPAGPAPGQPGSAILLDTDAASTYNPSKYPDTRFGDPSLAIDQDPTTAWTAQVEPATAPKLAVGLQIDLKSRQRLGSLDLVTTTPGMTVEIYGANGAQAPTTITDQGWVRLSSARPVKHNQHFLLSTGGTPFRFLVLWITSAPTPSPTASVAVNEVTVQH